jgi:hypothetical protein
MHTPVAQQIPLDFAPDARVWVYQCNRAFREKEVIEIKAVSYTHLTLPTT